MQLARIPWNGDDPFLTEGYGRGLAEQLVVTLDPQVHAGLNAMASVIGAAAVVGSTPPNFNPLLESYHHLDILRMVVFYNEDFGIQPQDSLFTRNGKFCQFLTEF